MYSCCLLHWLLQQLDCRLHQVQLQVPIIQDYKWCQLLLSLRLYGLDLHTSTGRMMVIYDNVSFTECRQVAARAA